MTQINPNINYNPYNVYPQQNQAQPVRLPNYYRVAAQNSDKPTIKEVIQENPFLSMPYEMLIKPFVEHPIAILGTWLGLGVALDAYSDANRGEYNKTLVKKAANLGDKIQNSKIIQNKPVQTVLNGIGSVGKAGGKVVNNSAILRAMKETPTMPEWSMVKSQMFNQKQEVVQDFIRIVDTLKLDTNQLPGLKDVGLNDTEKEMLKRVFNTQKISQIPEQEAVNHVLLNRLGKSPAEIEKIQKEHSIINLGSTFSNFSDTAGAIENMDLIISNDTSLVHLAGAMSKPCFVLLPYIYNWRWHTDLSHCDWYDSVKIYRQSNHGDWHGVFESVKADLLKEINV